MKKLAIVTTHPIQYYAPLFKLLSSDKRFEVKVFYTWGENSISKHDPGFNKIIEWDLPLLEGYSYTLLKNTSLTPGSHHFSGIINPDAIKRITQYQPDCVLIFGWSNHSHLTIIRHFSGKLPIWFRGDSTLLDEKWGVKNLFKYFLLKWIYSKVDKAFYVGTQNKLYFEKYGLTADKLEFCPHAIDNDRFAENHLMQSANIRKELGVTEHEILILYAGKFEEKKAPLLLLESVVQLNKEDVHILFVGNGELESNLKTYTRGLTSKTQLRKIHFMDFQNQTKMPALYQACDLFCLPSKGPGETWGLAVNEAMAAGNAILISDKVGCGIDLVKPGVNGEIFKSGDTNDLLLKLENILNLKKLKNYGDNSKMIIKNWTLEQASSRIISQLEQLK